VSRAWPDWGAVLCCWIAKRQSRWPQSVGAGAPGGTGYLHQQVVSVLQLAGSLRQVFSVRQRTVQSHPNTLNFPRWKPRNAYQQYHMTISLLLIAILNDMNALASAPKKQQLSILAFFMQQFTHTHTFIIADPANLVQTVTTCRCHLWLYFIRWSVTNFWWMASEETASAHTSTHTHSI